MLEILNGREKFYQWDINQKVVVTDENVIAVHFDNGTGDALICAVYDLDGVRVADVPNLMLQADWDIKVFACCAECVRYARKYEVERRSRPNDYFYTETETLNYSQLYKLYMDMDAVIKDIAAKTQELDAAIDDLAVAATSMNKAIEKNTSNIATDKAKLDKVDIELKTLTGNVDIWRNNHLEILNDHNRRLNVLEEGGVSGGAEIYWVDFEVDVENGTASTEKTHTEIYEAYTSGKIVIGRADTNVFSELILNLVLCMEEGAMFSATALGGTMYIMIADDGCYFGEFAAIEDLNVVVGNYENYGNGSWALGLNYAEIMTARQNHKGIIGYYLDGDKQVQMGLVEFNDAYATLMGFDGNYMYSVKIYSGDSFKYPPEFRKTAFSAGGSAASNSVNIYMRYDDVVGHAYEMNIEGTELLSIFNDKRMNDYEINLYLDNRKYEFTNYTGGATQGYYIYFTRINHQDSKSARIITEAVRLTTAGKLGYNNTYTAIIPHIGFPNGNYDEQFILKCSNQNVYWEAVDNNNGNDDETLSEVIQIVDNNGELTHLSGDMPTNDIDIVNKKLLVLKYLGEDVISFDMYYFSGISGETEENFGFFYTNGEKRIVFNFETFAYVPATIYTREETDAAIAAAIAAITDGEGVSY